MTGPATYDRIKEVNERYHDAAAFEYDSKWGIDFGEIGQRQVRLKLVKALGGLKGRSFGDALEIGSGTGYFSLNLVTSRGCPFHCNWCAKPIWGQRYHARSPEHVVEEMAWLQDHARPDHLWFMDDIMGEGV